MQNATKALLLVCALSVSISMAQLSEKGKFSVRVVKVSRIGRTGCTAQVDSAKVHYTISSNVAGACAMLRAGEDYRAFLGSGHPSAKDNSDDMAQMVIENNQENPERRTSVFQIDIEEARDAK